MSRYKYYRDGYCHRWYWTERHPEPDDDEVKRNKLNGRIVYRVRVEKRPVLCAVCPYFEETTGYKDVGIRWKPPTGSANLKMKGTLEPLATLLLDAGAPATRVQCLVVGR